MGQSILRNSIPRSGELLPVVGLGTWQTFDVGAGSAERAPLKEVLREFVQRGGSVMDSSPMYGRSETVGGEIAGELGIHKQLFIATKVWTSGCDAGIRQMEESFRRLRVKKLDLMQVHNLVDYRTHLARLRKWREEGKIRYFGVTHYHAGDYAELARVMATEELDFVQLNYSMAERDAEERLLPLAAEKRIALLVNRPFAEDERPDLIVLARDLVTYDWYREGLRHTYPSLVIPVPIIYPETLVRYNPDRPSCDVRYTGRAEMVCAAI